GFGPWGQDDCQSKPLPPSRTRAVPSASFTGSSDCGITELYFDTIHLLWKGSFIRPYAAQASNRGGQPYLVEPRRLASRRISPRSPSRRGIPTRAVRWLP